MQEEMKGIIQRRMDKFITPSMKVACFMDQRTVPAIFNHEVEEIIEEAIKLAILDVNKVNAVDEFKWIFKKS